MPAPRTLSLIESINSLGCSSARRRLVSGAFFDSALCVTRSPTSDGAVIAGASGAIARAACRIASTTSSRRLPTSVVTKGSPSTRAATSWPALSTRDCAPSVTTSAAISVDKLMTNWVNAFLPVGILKRPRRSSTPLPISPFNPGTSLATRVRGTASKPAAPNPATIAPILAARGSIKFPFVSLSFSNCPYN